jgi:hypothetical protein
MRPRNGLEPIEEVFSIHKVKVIYTSCGKKLGECGTFT